MFVGLKPKTPKPFNYSWYLISVQRYPIVDIVALEESEATTRKETYGKSGTQLSVFWERKESTQVTETPRQHSVLLTDACL